MKKTDLTQMILAFFKANEGNILPLKYIFKQLKLTTHPLKMLCMDVLYELQIDDYISDVGGGHYRLNTHGKEITGTFVRKSNGPNACMPDDGGEPIYISERNSGHAMHGDKVRISLYAKRKGREPRGEVIEILQRSNDKVVGTLEVNNGYAFLITDSRTLAENVFIPASLLKGGRTGDKAVVKILEWPEKYKNPTGRVVDILGQAGENNTEMHAILAEYGLPYSYPAKISVPSPPSPSTPTTPQTLTTPSLSAR